MDDIEILGRSDYIPLVLRVAVMAVPVALLTLIYLVFYHGGTQLVWETIPETLNVSRPVYTMLVATLGGLLVGLGLRYLGVRHGESLQKEMEAGRVPYQGVPGLAVTALIGLISGASLGPEGPLGHMGAALGSWISERLKLTPEKSRIMTLSGLSAAFGGFLLQPLGAAFMSMEFTGSLGYAIHLGFPVIPLSVAIAGTMAGLGGAIMRMPFTIILIIVTLSTPALLPINSIAAFTGFLSATVLEAGNARKAMYQASAKRRDVYGPSKRKSGD